MACEFSGVVREAFRRKGHYIMSCDLLQADDGEIRYHHQGDIRELLDESWNWDLMLAFPPCTHLAVSGAWKFKEKIKEQEEALSFIRLLLDAPIPKIALENPVGVISSRIRKPDQIIQPYQFGEDASKRTCLWLKGLPLLISPRIINGKKIWANQTPSGQNKLGPSPDRWKRRSITYQGIADAMASQWG